MQSSQAGNEHHQNFLEEFLDEAFVAGAFFVWVAPEEVEAAVLVGTATRSKAPFAETG